MVDSGSRMKSMETKLKDYEVPRSYGTTRPDAPRTGPMEVWQDAQNLAVDVYQDFAKCRDFSFVDQIKRVAVSVSNNIAEGAERTSSIEFARFSRRSASST